LLDFPWIFTFPGRQIDDINHIFPAVESGESPQPLRIVSQLSDDESLPSSALKPLGIVESTIVRNVIYKSQVMAVHSASESDSSLQGADIVSIVDYPGFSRVVRIDPHELRREGLACARGVGAALLLEAGIAVLGCAVWLLWHFVH
jgi:hypothetical protein